MKTLLRDLASDELDSVVQLANDAGFSWDRDAFLDDRPGKWDRSFAMVDGGRVVGYAVASVKGPATHLHQIVVRPESRGTGAADLLLSWVIDAARSAGDLAISLKVHGDNERALAFYRKQGFVLADAHATDDGYQRWELTLGPSSVCAVHQPNFLPYFGYFHKLARADVFVLMDDVQVPQGRSYASRTRILTPQGSQWLTVPTRRSHASDGSPASYRATHVAEPDWHVKVTKTLRANYARSPHFDQVMAILEPEMSGDTLASIGERLVRAIAKGLDLDTRIAPMSQLDGLAGQKSQLIISICRNLHATHYLSGTGGGRDYNDEEAFERAGLLVHYDDFVMKPYPQLWSEEFEPGLSIVDMLFNVGLEETRSRLTGARAL